MPYLNFFHSVVECVRIKKTSNVRLKLVEINPYLVQLKDLNDRGLTLRGYL